MGFKAIFPIGELIPIRIVYIIKTVVKQISTGIYKWDVFVIEVSHHSGSIN